VIKDHKISTDNKHLRLRDRVVQEEKRVSERQSERRRKARPEPYRPSRRDSDPSADAGAHEIRREKRNRRSKSEDAERLKAVEDAKQTLDREIEERERRRESID